MNFSSTKWWTTALQRKCWKNSNQHIIVDQLHGTLVAYEVRIEDEDMLIKEATFKVSSKQAGNKKTTKDKPASDESDDEEITNFVWKLKRGTGK